MNISHTAPIKLELFREIDKMTEKELIAIHQFIVKDHKKDFYDLLEDWQKEDIEAGLRDIKASKTMPVESFLKSL
ncbi:MAG: hypothetical protein EAZ53_09580 [Bacteroidetes bacterium]|nr:MAG: hypothetical protein EAZ53_09580 [Bacteroidota bacterium]